MKAVGLDVFDRKMNPVDLDVFDRKMNPVDLDDVKTTQLPAPDRPAPIQGRRQTRRFDRENFIARNNGFKRIQAYREPGHNADTARPADGRSLGLRSNPNFRFMWFPVFFFFMEF